MTDRTQFFNAVRSTVFRPSLSQSEVDAYALATAYWETAHTMHPINEAGGDGYFFRMYDPHGNRPSVAAEIGNTQPGDGAKFHGRGYVQLTGRALYQRAGNKIGVDLVDNPDLALDPANAARIMRGGMGAGWFTGREFASYLPSAGAATVDEFTQARRIINGQDHAPEIAEIALQFQAALS